MKRKISVLSVVIIVWLVFSVLYVGYTQYNYLRKYVADASYQKGLSDAVTQVIQQAQKCEAFPITIDKQGVKLINIACLQQNDGIVADVTPAKVTPTETE